MGSVRLEVKIHPNSSSTATMLLGRVFHVPGAACNGISLPLVRCHYELRHGANNVFQFVNRSNKDPMFCGISASQRMRLLLAEEKQQRHVPKHCTFDIYIAIIADWRIVQRLCPLSKAEEKRQMLNNNPPLWSTLHGFNYYWPDPHEVIKQRPWGCDGCGERVAIRYGGPRWRCRDCTGMGYDVCRECYDDFYNRTRHRHTANRFVDLSTPMVSLS